MVGGGEAAEPTKGFFDDYFSTMFCCSTESANKDGDRAPSDGPGVEPIKPIVYDDEDDDDEEDETETEEEDEEAAAAEPPTDEPRRAEAAGEDDGAEREAAAVFDRRREGSEAARADPTAVRILREGALMMRCPGHKRRWLPFGAKAAFEKRACSLVAFFWPRLSDLKNKKHLSPPP